MTDKDVLVNLVLEQIQEDIDAGEWSSLYGLLSLIDEKNLQAYLPEVTEDDFDA